MNSSTSKVSIRDVDGGNWRDVVKLSVKAEQRDFVAEPCYYLALCSYGKLWQPLAICLDEQIIGFMMWAVDSDDGSCWIGGFIIDQSHQKKGLGRQALKAVIERLSKTRGHQNFALSYQPSNISAKHLYTSFGFLETDEWEDGEVVARLSLTDR